MVNLKKDVLRLARGGGRHGTMVLGEIPVVMFFNPREQPTGTNATVTTLLPELEVRPAFGTLFKGSLSPYVDGPPQTKPVAEVPLMTKEQVA